MDNVEVAHATVRRRDDIVTGLVGPVIGTHAGPGMLGVAGMDPAFLSER